MNSPHELNTSAPPYSKAALCPQRMFRSNKRKSLAGRRHERQERHRSLHHSFLLLGGDNLLEILGRIPAMLLRVLHSGDELGDHIQRTLRLILREEMAGLAYHHVRQAHRTALVTDIARRVRIRGVHLPDQTIGSLPCGGTTPGQLTQKSLALGGGQDDIVLALQVLDKKRRGTFINRRSIRSIASPWSHSPMSYSH